MPFEPTVSTEAGTTSTDSPAPATVEVAVPFEPHADIYQSNVKTVKLSLPQGMGRTRPPRRGSAPVKKRSSRRHSREAISCPANSRLGSVRTGNAGAAPKGSLKGSVYLAKPEGRDPESGKLYRLFLEGELRTNGASRSASSPASAPTRRTARSPRRSKTRRRCRSNRSRSGSTARKGLPLTSPSTCGPNVTTHEFGAYSGSPTRRDHAWLQPQRLTGRRPLREDRGRTPVLATFAAGPSNSAAKAAVGYTVTGERRRRRTGAERHQRHPSAGRDREPQGRQLRPRKRDRRGGREHGKAQIASPSCPASSFIGTVKIAAGSGGYPLQLAGNAYLAGPYKGAPLSMAIVTPALAGTFDLGDVVVHAAVFVEPETRPDPRRLRSDPGRRRRRQGRHPLSSASNSRGANFIQQRDQLQGREGQRQPRRRRQRPSNAADFTSRAVSAVAQLEGCKALQFKPRLKLSLSGKTKRTGHPHLKAVLNARSGKDADVGSLSVALPHTLFLDQASLGTVCTRVQFAAEQCPTKSIYGHARAWSPLLEAPLEGPVYLRSSEQQAPRPGRPPARPGDDRPGRADRLLQGRNPDQLRIGAGPPGVEVRTEPARRQGRPPGRLEEPLRGAGQGRSEGGRPQQPGRQPEPGGQARGLQVLRAEAPPEDGPCRRCARPYMEAALAEWRQIAVE